MKLEVKISTKIDANDWNNQLAKNPNSTIYQSFAWQKLYHDAFGSKPVFITVLNDANVVGQLACLIHKKMLWGDANPLARKVGNKLELGTALWWYHGPIIHDQQNSDEILLTILSTVDKIAKENKAVVIRGISSPLTEQFPPEIFKNFLYIF